MHVLVDTGTDTAALAVGDVEAIHDVLHATSLDTWLELRDRAVSSGALWRTETGRDGSFLVGLFVDEDPGTELSGYLRDPLVTERFRVPSGRVLVAGEEAFIATELENAKMGELVTLPTGEFSLTAYRTEFPDDIAKSVLRDTVSPELFRAWSVGNALPAVCAIATVACLVIATGLYLLARPLVSAVPVAIAVVAWIWQARFRQSGAYRSALERYRQIALR